MKIAISALLCSAALVPFATAGSYVPISMDLGGDSSYNGWWDVTSGNGYGGLVYPGTGAWTGTTGSWTQATPPGGTETSVIKANTQGSGDAFLYKIDNGPAGGPYPGAESIYFGGSTGIVNNKGGSLGIADNAPLLDAQTVTFQIAIAGAYGYDFYNNVTPTLFYTTEAGTFSLSANYTQLLSQVYNGVQNIPTGQEAIYINLWGLQYDLRGIEGILSLDLKFTAVEHAQVYAMQLDQSTQAYIQNAFPQSRIWTGSGNWSNSANWDGGTVPNSGRDITVSGGNMVLDSTRTVGMVKLDAADGFTLSSTNGAVLVSNSGFISDPSTASSYTISAPVRMDEFNTINLGANADLTFEGSISGAAFYKQGSGSLNLKGDNFFGDNAFNEVIFSGGNNSISGVNTYIGTGAFSLVLRDGNLVLQGGDNRLSPNFSLSLHANSGSSAKLTLGGIDGAIRQTVVGLSGVVGTSIVGGHSNVSTLIASSGTFNGNLGGVGLNENNLALTKRDGGTLILGGTNTYSGATTIEGGTLLINGANALSVNSNVVFDGGVLGLGAGDFNRSLGTGAGQVQFVGDGGFAAYGVSRDINIGGAGAKLTWGSGNFIQDGKTLIFSGTASSIRARLVNGIDLGNLSRSIRVDTNSAAEMVGVLSGAGGITKSGGGTLHLTASNSYGGVTNIQAGTISVSGTYGSIAGNVVVGAGATLQVANTADANSPNRLSDSASVRLNGGILSVTVSGTADFSETIGNVILGAGGSTIATGTAANGRANTLTLASLTRTDGATLNFNATTTGASNLNRVFINGQANGLLGGWATIGNSDFATYDSVNGIRVFSSYVNSDASAWVAADNVKYTTSGTRVLDSNKVINTLNLSGSNNGAFSVNLNQQTLRLASGGLLVNGGNANTVISITNGSLTAGSEVDVAAELYVHRTSGSGTAIISANVVDNGSGSVSIVKAGAGALTLSGSNSHSGGTRVNQGILNINHAYALGTGTFTLGRNTTINNTSGSNLVVATNNHHVWSDGFTFSGNGNDLDLGKGAVTLTSDVTVTASGTRTLTVGGGISGTYSLTSAGASTLILGGTNTYTGRTSVTAGTLQIATNGTISGNGDISVANRATLRVNGFVGGSGVLTIDNGGTLAGSGTISRSFVVGRGATIAPGNSPGTLHTASQTWESGGIYSWSINDVDAGEGVGWSSLDINGTLNLTASANDQFVLKIDSLTLANLAGVVADFDADAAYQWRILTASGGITGFDASAISIDLGLFKSIPDIGSFYIFQSGDSLYLNYGEVIPEPGTWAMMVLGGGGLLWHLRRRKSA